MRDRILVVDDDASVLLLLRRVLESAGYQVRTAAGLEEAVAVFRGEPCELLVVDKHMPGATGFDVVRQLRELYPDLPAIMVTAYPEPVLTPGPVLQGHLVKPFQPMSDFLAHVAKVLELTRRSIALGLARSPPAVVPTAGSADEVVN